MLHQDLRQTLIHSASCFFSHITERGQTATPLKLRSAPFAREGVVHLPLQRRGIAEQAGLFLNDDNAEILGYDPKSACLKVRLYGEVTPQRVSALEVYSDISFLVKRLLNWALEHNPSFPLGNAENAVLHTPILPASLEQQAAVEGVLSSPLCYVWGVPGSGKTSMVLAECLMHYIRQGRKALLIAPTNSALERALTALLPVLEQHGIPGSAALRLGIPSDEFAGKYPQLCWRLNSGPAPRLLAATADSFINYYEDIRRFGPGHVFLDEAGYCPLVKALPLLSLGAPLAMLGDHKQLAPVCPLERRDILREPSLCLWSLSAAYMGNLLRAEDVKELAAAKAPDFSALPRFDLGTSYRFGGELAEALSEQVYEGVLKSVSNGTDVTILHGVPGRNRTSFGEAMAIQRYLKERCPSDCAILTPYRKQVRLLKDNLPHQEVMTIHRAQGLEWDTVILSVVDGEDMFFTDSTSPRGQTLMNTAVSRAKKHLVIACDTKRWGKRPNQLLGRLVNAFPGAA